MAKGPEEYGCWDSRKTSATDRPESWVDGMWWRIPAITGYEKWTQRPFENLGSFIYHVEKPHQNNGNELAEAWQDLGKEVGDG